MRTSTRRLGVTAAALLAATTLTTGAAAANPRPLGAQLGEVRAATARYHDVDAAVAAGYAPTEHCVATPAGAMGRHYVNMDLVLDGQLDPARPEVLLYAPQPDGSPRLVGVEYLSLTPTSLFSQQFDAGPGGTFALHAWVWQGNPDGTFAPFNPNVTC